MSDEWSFEIEADVYRAQRRPHHGQIVVNDDYRGLLVLDPWTGQVVSRVAFASGYGADGVIDGWALRADGGAAVVFNDAAQRACAMALDGTWAHSVEHPAWRCTTGMVYDWRGDDLWMKDPAGFAFAVVDRTLTMRPRDPTEVLTENRAWRRATDRMRRAGASCLRVEPERARALVVARDPDRIGTFGWVDEPEDMVPLRAKLGRVAAAGDRFAILEEYELTLLDAAGIVMERFRAPDGFHFVDLDAVTGSAGTVLVLVASALDGRIVTRFIVRSV